MNLGETVFELLTSGTLVQVVSVINNSQQPISRIGRVYLYDDDIIILKPHGSKLIYEVYGGDIEAKYSILRIKDIVELLILIDDEESLKKLQKINSI